MNNYLKLLENKRLMILGFGREGVSTYTFLRKLFPDKQIIIADKNQMDKLTSETRKVMNSDNKITYFGGIKYLDSLEQAEIVIKSPGIPNKIIEIKKAKEKGIEFTSQTKLFFECFSGVVVGVTGTKGKSTTSSLIHHILKSSGVNSELMGNIGKPPLDYLSRDNIKIFVFEMSSHQLSDLEKSPHIAVFLNIYPEHLDYYESFDDYFQAKANITKYQTQQDLFIYNGKFKEINNLSETTDARAIDFTKFNLPTISTKLRGTHNIDNIKAAFLAAGELGVDDENIAKAISTFEPLQDRIELVGEVDGVSYINDGLATIPQATIAAIESFEDKQITLILGGFDRGVDFDLLGRNIKDMDNVVNIILTGQVSQKLENVFTKYKFSGKLINLGTAPMDSVVKTCAEVAAKGSVVLLSPGATSFDMYKDYKDRADKFKRAVLEMGRD